MLLLKKSKGFLETIFKALNSN